MERGRRVCCDLCSQWCSSVTHRVNISVLLVYSLRVNVLVDYADRVNISVPLLYSLRVNVLVDYAEFTS